MIRGSLLSCLPKGFFKWPLSQDDSMDDSSYTSEFEQNGRKRRRRSSNSLSGGNRTPALVTPTTRRYSFDVPSDEESASGDRPLKKFRGNSKIVSVPRSISNSLQTQQQNSPFLSTVPEDAIVHCLSFLGSVEDRSSLQLTCKIFRDLSNADTMLAQVSVSGNVETGKLGIIRDTDSPATAAAALAPFARAGNLEALYMLGIVKCYCYQDLRNGILMLKIASSHGFVRSSYTLGIILRDALPEQATQFMKLAASTGYLPALQELLSVREMKERFGEPNADALRRHLDPACLNRLLLRDYVDSAELRGFNTSHCWNPLCGKWAYKATNPTSAVRMRRPTRFGQQDIQQNVNDDGFAASLSRRPNIALGDGNEQNNNNNDGAASGGDMNAPPDNSKPCVTISPKKSPQALAWEEAGVKVDRVARMKMCSRCCRAKYCSKLCQVYDWRSSQHKQECQFL
ncbi:unnamed protein product [Cylindrotheca closterium]|uniref:MYND-type domain-containing protein n=1 Tax=Cylindrotheca closterium TaxID=2856 RepID=A0AAD2JJ02_9STRA|nr:unnamed protein product [Cylindrotheca closterium]